MLILLRFYLFVQKVTIVNFVNVSGFIYPYIEFLNFQFERLAKDNNLTASDVSSLSYLWTFLKLNPLKVILFTFRGLLLFRELTWELHYYINPLNFSRYFTKLNL